MIFYAVLDVLSAVAYLGLGKGGGMVSVHFIPGVWGQSPWSGRLKLSHWVFLDLQWMRQICPLFWNLETQKTTDICVLSPRTMPPKYATEPIGYARCPSILYGLTTWKQNGTENQNYGVNTANDSSNQCVNFQSEKSKIRVRAA